MRSFVFPEKDHPFIIHGAVDTDAKVDNETPLTIFDTIVQGTRRALDYAVKARCLKFLFISSGAVYGKQPPEMTNIPESYLGGPDTMEPGSDYGEAKRAAEFLCSSYHTRYPNIETKIARCFAFVGPHMPLNSHFAIGNFIRDAIHGPVQSGGTPCVLIIRPDLAIWLWTITGTARRFQCGFRGSRGIRNGEVIATWHTRPCRGPFGLQARAAAALYSDVLCGT